MGYRAVFTEMPFYDYRIDVFAFSERLDASVAVELKLTKWKRAFEQALIYQLCADQAFVAVPKETVPRVDAGLLKQHGIGLIGVSRAGGSWRCRVVVPARASEVVRPHYRSDLLALLSEFS
jgi:hypothetical protein